MHFNAILISIIFSCEELNARSAKKRTSTSVHHPFDDASTQELYHRHKHYMAHTGTGIMCLA